ncbi:MAG: NAD-dependent epimerase/dehydratase family protein [Gammaproteobacteria bacterium]|nr:NAD-dependent epimerase/dehydratase family protein [Gammaproteobacteria bacterium]
MKIAVFGGSGFLGYDFIRFALKRGGIEPVIYSSSAKSLSNLARHEVDIRLYAAAEPQAVELDRDVGWLVNFAHPFERRGSISGKDQIARFVQFVGNAKRSCPGLRLIHLSSMSVYEPFARGLRFVETDALNPPRHDRYAEEKVFAETALRALPGAAAWQLHLRPTVVYGPFCGVWTDRILEAFTQGDVGFCDLSGHIQPIHGEDVSRFIYERLFDFRAGVYNLPGPEEISWQTFLETFRDIVGIGRLVALPDAVADRDGGSESAWDFYVNNVRELMRAVRKEPSFDRLAWRVARHLPVSMVQWVRSILLGRDAAAAAPCPIAGKRPVSRLYSRRFFGEDRLVDGARLMVDFPACSARRMSQVRDELSAYYRFRFTDARFT